MSRSCACKTIAASMLVATLVITLAGVAAAQKLEALGSNGAWKAFAFRKGDVKVCYMASAPIKSEGKYTQRGEIFALVTNDPTTGARGEVSIVTGYDYKADSEAMLTVGGTVFAMFTKGDKAWTRGPEEDAALVRAMVKGRDMVITGTSERGTSTKDTYSLSGFTATKKIIDGACKS
ncbi:MAG: hypothetical protein HQ481_15590 [Alphaproteobacteria bacterium]|nr:hypothetical protein [Alphaproteobacteria bacterium]